MPECPFCGSHLVRRHRTTYQKLLYADAYRCKQCGLKTYRWRPELRFDRWFISSRFARCPRCSRGDVQRMRKRDRIDSHSKHVLSRVQRWLFAPLNKCGPCRMQFYDFRPIKSSAVDAVPGSPSSGPDA